MAGTTPTTLSQLPPPPSGQTGISPASLKGLPPPPSGQTGMTLQQVQQQPADVTAPPDTSIGSKIANFLGVAGKGIYNGAVKLGNNVIDGVEHPSVLLDRLQADAPQGNIVTKDANGNFVADPAAMKDMVDKTAGFAGGDAGEEAKTAINAIPAEVSAGAAAKTAADTAAQNAAHGSFIDELLTPDMNKKATASAIKTGKVAEGTGINGARDFTSAVPGFDNIKSSVAQVPGVAKGNTMLENVNAIHDAIGTTAQDLRTQLGNQEVTPVVTQDNWNKYLGGIKQSIQENPLLVGDAEQTANKILAKFQSMLPSEGDITATHILDARQGLDKWISSLKPNAFDPATENAVSIALRAVRQGANQLIADSAPNVEVKNMLAHQSNLFNAIDTIAPKAAAEGNSAFSRFVTTVKKNPITSTAVGSGLTALGIDKIIKAVTGVGF